MRPPMASKNKTGSLGGTPWALAIPAVHAVLDFVTHASSPDCGNQAVLSVCLSCNKLASS